MNRRSFIQTSAATSVALCLPGMLAASPASRWPSLSHPHVIGIIGEEEAAAAGQTYRRLFPDQADPERIAALIAPNSTRTLDQRVRIDFAEGRTLQLNGWVLSLTEARQCALFSFLHP